MSIDNRAELITQLRTALYRVTSPDWKDEEVTFEVGDTDFNYNFDKDGKVEML